MNRSSAAWPLQILAAIAVVVVLLAGIWVSGGVITNDFRLATALTAVWMGIAAAACLAIAMRSRGLRLPVIVGYLLTAIAAAGYLERSQLVDDTLNQGPVTANGFNMLL